MSTHFTSTIGITHNAEVVSRRVNTSQTRKEASRSRGSRSRRAGHGARTARRRCAGQALGVVRVGDSANRSRDAGGRSGYTGEVCKVSKNGAWVDELYVLQPIPPH